jgi:hypothetical protein
MIDVGRSFFAFAPLIPVLVSREGGGAEDEGDSVHRWCRQYTARSADSTATD